MSSTVLVIRAQRAHDAAPAWDELAALAARVRGPRDGPGGGFADGGTAEEEDADRVRSDRSTVVDGGGFGSPAAAVRVRAGDADAAGQRVLRGTGAGPHGRRGSATPLDWLLSRGFPLGGMRSPDASPPPLSPAAVPRPLPSRPFPDLGPGAPTPQAVLDAALGRFFAHTHPFLPLVHRASFEAATRGVPCASFPSRKPAALLYALAAQGVRMVPELDRRKRLAVARWCSLKARDLLFALDARSDLEALLVAVMLCKLLAIAGLPGRMFALLQLAAQSAEGMVSRLPPGPPEDSGAWVRREHVLRARMITAAFDYGMAHYSNRPTFGRYFGAGGHADEPVAVAERYFDHANTEAAFAAVRASWGDQEPRLSFPTSYGDHPPASRSAAGDDFAAAAVRVARDMAILAFGAGSALYLLHLDDYARHHLQRIRREAAEAGCPPSRRDGIVVASLAEVALSALTPDVGGPFARGDPGPFLDAWHLIYPDEQYAVSMPILFLYGEFFAVETLVLLGFSRAAQARSLRAASLVRGLLRRDPGFENGSFTVVGACITMGTVLLDALRPGAASLPQEDGEDGGRASREQIDAALRLGVRTFARALELLGRGYGLRARQASDAFRAAVHASLANPDPGAEERQAEPQPEELDDDAPGERAKFSWDVLVDRQQALGPVGLADLPGLEGPLAGSPRSASSSGAIP
ncbi:hypothetical protein DFJ74DRAFT_764546 [Hyaloraphidium curvatum]|nr:hypothetical protein DFJ74DRAFT_764546 [Hyaloraphidium curvatum]